MPKFSPEEFSFFSDRQQIETELGKLQRALYLIQQNYKMQLWQMAEQMNEDFDKLTDQIVYLKNLNNFK